ncbi:MAG: hypothetical protein IKK14_08255 [Oscillospiraceae bacterium]|nr:hypothetical protein [Oscillospiraceae bacterium]
MLRKNKAVVRTKKYGKLIRISAIFAAIAISAGLIAYGWQQYEEEKYPEGTEMDYSLPNAFIDFARLINDFITQNANPEETPSEVNASKPEREEKDNIIIVGSEEPETSGENPESSEPEEPEIRGGIVPQKDNAGFYSFKDTLFVGDYFLSQVHSLGYFDRSKFAYTTDLDMNTMLTKKVLKLNDEYVTLADYAESFKDKDIEAVYIIISAESVSWMDVPTFVKKYTAFVEEIVSSFPEAHVYVQPILPINEEKAAKRGYSVTNEKINRINEYIYSLAEERSFWILDMAKNFANENGTLPEEYTTNGIRFEKDTYEIWSNFVVTHKAH